MTEKLSLRIAESLNEDGLLIPLPILAGSSRNTASGLSVLCVARNGETTSGDGDTRF